jgi:hypothetical protein
MLLENIVWNKIYSFSNGFTVTWTPNIGHTNAYEQYKEFPLLQKLSEEKLYFCMREAKVAAN